MTKVMYDFKASDCGSCALSAWNMCLFDKNCDMALEKEEFANMLKCHAKVMKAAEPSSEQIDAEFKKADCNGDGKVGNCWPTHELKHYFMRCAKEKIGEMGGEEGQKVQ